MFLVILLYYVCLYRYISELSAEDNPNLIHFCAAYPALDFILIIVSFFVIHGVKKEARELIEHRDFKEYSQDAEVALADILYLPQEFETDENEEDL